MIMHEVFDLNPEQKKAFNRLAKAYKDCKALKILLVNNYGAIEAYDKKFVKDYRDTNPITGHGEDIESIPTRNGTLAENYFNASDLVSWADDEHFVVLTSAGRKLYRNE